MKKLTGILLLPCLMTSLAYPIFGSKNGSTNQDGQASTSQTPAPAERNTPTAQAQEKTAQNTLSSQLKPGTAALCAVIAGYLGYKYGADSMRSIFAPAVVKSLKPRNETVINLTLGAAGAGVGGSLGYVAGAGAAHAVEYAKLGTTEAITYVKNHKDTALPAIIGAAAGIGGIVLVNKLK